MTCRGYGFDVLLWHRLLWLLEIEWDRATEACGTGPIGNEVLVGSDAVRKRPMC